jgi:acyl-CoA synthetase (AMP-forming)/AMP-acid ligase II/acyl carrier protein
VARALREFPRLRLVHGYGPVESMGLVTTFPATEPEVTEATAVPIGRPVGNKRVYVLDSMLRPVPPGVIGEVYLAGPCLAEGYLHHPGRSAQRFVANPFGAPGERMFRTGDLARWRANGVLEHAGQVDEQVEIHGFRVELAAVESALCGHPAVLRAAVAVHRDCSGERRLVAYVVTLDNQQVTLDALREQLSSVLPEHVLPSAVMMLPALPLTLNGKLDRLELPEPDFAPLSTGREPRTPQERTMCALFCDVLGLPEVGIDDSFLDLGGHSVLATRLISRIRSTFGAELSIRAVFEAPTVARLVQRLAGAASP